MSGFGHDDDGGDPPTDSGTYVVSGPDGGSQTFTANVQRDGLATLDIVYAGTIEGGYTGATVWSGSGTFTRGGFGDPSGTVEASTEAQRRDSDVCSSQNVSGRTTIVHSGQTLVVTYDGATNCDEDQTAQHAVDGEDRGPVTGVACAASPARGGESVSLLLVGLAGLLLARRRWARGLQ